MGRAGPQRLHLQGFFDELTDEQKASIKAVSIDMSARYEKAITETVPDGRVGALTRSTWASSAAGRPTRSAATSTTGHGRSATGEGKWIKGTPYSLLKDTANQTARQLVKLPEVVLTNKRMYRAFLLLGELRYLYRPPKDEAVERLDAWLAWASRSRLRPFIKLARTIRQHKQGRGRRD